VLPLVLLVAINVVPIGKLEVQPVERRTLNKLSARSDTVNPLIDSTVLVARAVAVPVPLVYCKVSE
jgi:hypothetical protein